MALPVESLDPGSLDSFITELIQAGFEPVDTAKRR